MKSLVLWPVNVVCTLGSLAFDALSAVSNPIADAIREEATRRDAPAPSSEVTYLDEIAYHLAAQTPLLEDTRNLLQHIVSPSKPLARYPFGRAAEGIATEYLSESSAAPGRQPQPAAAAEGPARGEPRSRTSRAGHPTSAEDCSLAEGPGARSANTGQPNTAAADQVPAGSELRAHSSAGHINPTSKLLRVAADGLRQWTDGDQCPALSYWRSIAVQLDAVAIAREAIEDVTK